MFLIDGYEVSEKLFSNYIESVVPRFFKILPLREEEEPSLGVYMETFKAELLGCQSLMVPFSNDAMFLSLISILQYLIDHECDIPTVKREVFGAIKLCNELKQKYYGEEGESYKRMESIRSTARDYQQLTEQSQTDFSTQSYSKPGTKEGGGKPVV